MFSEDDFIMIQCASSAALLIPSAKEDGNSYEHFIC